MDILRSRGTGEWSVTELYSMPAVFPILARLGFIDHGSFDLENGWDSREFQARANMRVKIRQAATTVTFMSPPCGKLSNLQALTADERRKDPKQFARDLRDAIRDVHFCLDVAEDQMENV